MGNQKSNIFPMERSEIMIREAIIEQLTRHVLSSNYLGLPEAKNFGKIDSFDFNSELF